MPLDVILNETHAIDVVVRGAELVLALDATETQSALRLRVQGAGGIWRHLLGDKDKRRLRVLETSAPAPGGAHSIWIGHLEAAPQTLVPGTWCIDTALRAFWGSLHPGPMTLAVHLLHPDAAGVSQLGCARRDVVPFAVSDAMRGMTTRAASGICVVGAGDVHADRALIALVVGRTAGDVVVFDPYQHHLAQGLPGVKRIVAPCGPSRRAMLYASCRYVVSAHDRIGHDDHFVCEAVAMGLLPLAAFAPAPLEPLDVWDAPAMAAAFSSAVAQVAPKAVGALMPQRLVAQAHSVRAVLQRLPSARPWGSFGPLGFVQYVRPQDVAAVGFADCRALIVVCGAQAQADIATREWLARCAYRAICVTGPGAQLFESHLQPQLGDAALCWASSPVLMAAFCARQRRHTPRVQFDVVHLGDSAASVLSMRQLARTLEQSAAGPADAAKTISQVVLVVCARADSTPRWQQVLAQRHPRCWVLHLHPHVHTTATKILQNEQGEPADWACLALLLTQPYLGRVIDAGGGGARLSHLCEMLGAPTPERSCDAMGAYTRPTGLDTARFVGVHKGAARAALGWPAGACIVLVQTDTAPPIHARGMAFILSALATLRARGHGLHLCWLAPALSAAEAQAFETRLEAEGLSAHVSLCEMRTGSMRLNPAEAQPEPPAPSVMLGAADIFVAGLAAPSATCLWRDQAMAASLPVIAAAPCAGAAFVVAAAADAAMQDALVAYLQTLIIDAPLRARLGQRAKKHLVARADLGVQLDAWLHAPAAPHAWHAQSPKVISAQNIASYRKPKPASTTLADA